MARVADFSLDGKSAIVTGGSRGIGRSIALALAEAGARVVVAARKLPDMEGVVNEIRQRGGVAIAVETNVRESAQLENLVQRTIAEFGRIDILVNNAGTNPVFGGIESLDDRAWDVIMSTNVRAAWQLSKLCRPHMIANGGGSIINVSSTGGLRPSFGLGCYSVSKAALIMLTRVMASEWGRQGIRVNCIAPGLIRTEFSRALWDNPQILENALRQTPLGRIGEPDEMAGTVVFLASPAASYIDAQVFAVDGGGS